MTIGHGQVRETVGIPGTGLSYTNVESMHQRAHDDADELINAGPGKMLWKLICLVAVLIAIAALIARLL